MEGRASRPSGERDARRTIYPKYPCALSNSALSSAAPAAPRIVLCDNTVNFQSAPCMDAAVNGGRHAGPTLRVEARLRSVICLQVHNRLIWSARES